MITTYLKTLGTATSLGIAVFAGFASGKLQAQVNLAYETYGTNGPANGAAPTTGTNTLGPITVDQIYTNSTSTYTYNFVYDASGVYNYIYEPISVSAPDPFVVGDTYSGLSLTSAPYGTPANLELAIPTGVTEPPASLIPTATGGAGMYLSVAEGSLTTTSAISDSFSTTPPLDIEPVQFTFTAPTTQTVTPITGNATITDANNGDKINFYRPTTGLTFTAGSTYTIDGFAFAYSTGVEIYDPAIVATGVPEPASYVLMGCGALGLVLVARRTRNVKLA